MKYFGNILKISIILIIILMAVGSIHATDNSSSKAIDDSDDDFELDDYLDDSDDEDFWMILSWMII